MAANQHGGIPVEEERLPMAPAQQFGASSTSPVVQRRPYFEIRRSDSNLPWSSPTQGFVTRRYDPANRHFGIDIAGKIGTAIYAAADGHVIFSGWTVDDGNMIIIAHDNGFVTFYKHNQTLLIGNNTTVRRGEPIALLGNSGKTSFGPHLHFEVWFNGMPRDPGEFIVNAHL
jgi:murein DD-endopeptidase MepM/ murein hydrolase activator NlpD